MQIKIPYSPRALQAQLHAEMQARRWGVVVCHRRFGKTVWAINHILRDALMSSKPAPRYAMMAPTYRQAKSVSWDLLKQYAGSIPGVRFNETELRCDLPNGARISLLGAENGQALRGLELHGVVMDEYANMPESVFPEVIRPSLSTSKGWCCFIGTPQGHNAFYELYEQAKGDDEWLAVVHKASETGLLDREELEAAQKMMSPDQYAQEFECSWQANVPGSIYGKELEQAEDDGRVTNVPYDPALRVSTFWDLGVGDSTAVFFVQTAGRAVHVIDYYEARGEGLPHYCKVLSQKGYLYQDHFAPHDIEQRELGSGKSRREIAYDLGLNFRVVPKLGLEDGIHAAKMLIPKCWFDRDKTKVGLEALRQYHRAYNERTRTFRATPVHDWSSHSADAFRYLAVGLRLGNNKMRAPQQQALNSYNVFAA